MAALQTPWYNKTAEALQLNGKGKRTQQAYARAVRMLIRFLMHSDSVHNIPFFRLDPNAHLAVWLPLFLPALE